MSGLSELNDKLNFLISVWNGRNLFLWYSGLFLLSVGIILNRFEFLKKKEIPKRIIKLLPLTGIICILLCFLSGAGAGIGIGDGEGFGIGDGGNSDGKKTAAEEDFEPNTMYEAMEYNSDKQELTIVVEGNDVTVGNWKCADSDIGATIDAMNRDDIIVVLEDHYAYYEPYMNVKRILESNAIKYNERVYEDNKNEE